METGTKQFRVRRGIRLAGRTFALNLPRHRATREFIPPIPTKSWLKLKRNHPCNCSSSPDNQRVPAYSSPCERGISPPGPAIRRSAFSVQRLAAPKHREGGSAFDVPLSVPRSPFRAPRSIASLSCIGNAPQSHPASATESTTVAPSSTRLQKNWTNPPP
jgi:hypothetical protein